MDISIDFFNQDSCDKKTISLEDLDVETTKLLENALKFKYCIFWNEYNDIPECLVDKFVVFDDIKIFLFNPNGISHGLKIDLQEEGDCPLGSFFSVY